jgi:hypothetical protein
MANPFHFYTEMGLIELLGKKAKNLTELLAGIRTVPGSCIYHHTHKFLKQHHFLSPEPPNDFAYWAGSVFGDELLGEKLAAVDIIQFRSIRELRDKFVTTIEMHLRQGFEERNVFSGYEFHFMKARSFVIKTGHIAGNLQDFLDIIKKIDAPALYFHIFEARIRLERDDNDFSYWLGMELGEDELAQRIAKIDPYTITLEGLRKKIVNLIEERLHA